jgi:hypothetical protein
MFAAPQGPVVAHPPCRLFSKYCAHQAKPKYPLREVHLAARCVHWVQANGGIIEQPAGSRLGEVFGLGRPVYVDQSWWGFPTMKRTWLWFVGCQPGTMPFRLAAPGMRRAWQLMSRAERAATPEAFAVWLLETASLARGHGLGQGALADNSAVKVQLQRAERV